MTAVYIALGSNIEPEQHLARAVAELAAAGEVLTLTAASRTYRTPPWGDTDQPPFLNAVLAAQTNLEPLPLLDRLQAVEALLGRRRTRKWGPRTIDLDLLFHGDRVMDTPRLTLPHPLSHERAFVLVPLCDLAPRLRHPVLGRAVADLLREVDATGVEPAGGPLWGRE